jgi:hypothetical protein
MQYNQSALANAIFSLVEKHAKADYRKTYAQTAIELPELLWLCGLKDALQYFQLQSISKPDIKLFLNDFLAVDTTGQLCLSQLVTGGNLQEKIDSLDMQTTENYMFATKAARVQAALFKEFSAAVLSQ